MTYGDPAGRCRLCGKVVKDLDAHHRRHCPKTFKARCGKCSWWEPWSDSADEIERVRAMHARATGHPL